MLASSINRDRLADMCIEREDGRHQRTVRFVVDLPPSQLGPGGSETSHNALD